MVRERLMRAQWKTVGHVRELFLYPVKSMRGMSVPEVTCGWYGVNGDRKYAFVQDADLSGFPWLTARELPALLQYAPYFVDAASPLSSAIRVRTPYNRDLPLEAPDLTAELSGQSGGAVSLLRLKRGTFDCMPLSIITSATIEMAGQAAGRSLDARRFRPNIFIDGAPDMGEATWINSTLIFGEREDAARIQINYPTKRCVMINLDPDNSQSDSRVLKAVAATSRSLAGMYAAVSRPGTIRVSDRVYLHESE